MLLISVNRFEFTLNFGDAKEWWLNGKLHREDGPAIDYPAPYGERSEEWYINGEKISRGDFNIWRSSKK